MPEIRKATKLSPLNYPLTKAGAVLTNVSGWLLAEHFGNAGEEARWVSSHVGLCDLSCVPKFELQGKDLAAALLSDLGIVAPSPGRAVVAEWGYACRLSPNHALLIFDAVGSPPPAWLGRPQAECVHVVDRTNGHAGVLIRGPAAPDVLRKLSPLDIREEKFPNLSCAAGPMAAVRVILVRRDTGGLPGYEVFFSREYAEYLWEAIIEAGAEFEMRPFGLAAARLS